MLGPARIAKKTIFGDGPKRKSRLFYLPTYPPDRNPDALVYLILELVGEGISPQDIHYV